MNVSSTSKQRKHVIAIGSNTCAAMNYANLARVSNDVKKIKDILIEKQGYTEALANLYVGATSQKIKSDVGSWFASQEFNYSDCVIIYYAGHGGHHNDDHYLYTIDSNPSDIFNTAIKTSDLISLLFPRKQTSPQNILLILDVCYAGSGAKQGLAKRLITSIQDGRKVTFGVITSADSNSVAGDGDFVDAFETTMKDTDWMSKYKDEFLHPFDLVNCINEFLQKKGQGQKVYFDITDQSTRLTFFRNPYYFSSTQIKSGEQIIANCLFSLDYCPQEKIFTKVMEDHQQKAIAFLIQTDNTTIQRWLVGRLARLVSDFNTAKRYQIQLRRHNMLSNFEALWQEEFKDALTRENGKTRETVIQALADFWNTKSVIIAIYGLSRLTKEKVEEFHTFWLDLVKEVNGRGNFRSSRLVLLLAERNQKDVIEKLRPLQFNDLSSIYKAIHLEPLETIQKNDVIEWLKKTNVYDSINLRNDEVNAIVKEIIPNFSETPLEMLEDICCDFFKIRQEEVQQKIIDEIAKYWSIAV
jgi:hypothetical protein